MLHCVAEQLRQMEREVDANQLYKPCRHKKGYPIPRSFVHCHRKSQQAFLYLHSTPQFLSNHEEESRSAFTVGIDAEHLKLIPDFLKKVSTKFIPPVQPIRNNEEGLEIMERLKKDFFEQLRWYMFFTDQGPDDDEENSEDAEAFDRRFWTKTTKKAPIAQRVHRHEEPITKLVDQFLSSSDQLKYERSTNYDSKKIALILRNLQTRAKIVVKAADKNLGITFMSIDWYLDQVRKHLRDETTYTLISDGFESPMRLQVTRNCFQKWLGLFTKQLIRHHESLVYHRGFTMQMVTYLLKVTEEDFARFPEFHAIPKMHKDPPSTRPIVPTHSWGTMRISKVLSFLLRPQLKHLPWIIDDMSRVRELLGKFSMRQDTDYYIMTGDVTSLYTNIPLAAGYKAIREMSFINLRLLVPPDLDVSQKAVYSREAGLLSDTLGSMTKFVMENNYFTSGRRLFRQIQGTAMGTNMAPEFANIYMGVAEYHKLEHWVDLGCCLYLRYIDDIVIIGPREQLDRVALRTAFLDLPLQVNWESPSKSLPFLDLQLSIANNSIVYELYRKPINTYQYLEWHSEHPRTTKKGFVVGEVIRIFRNCSSEAAALRHVEFFHDKIRRRGYPPYYTHRWIRDAIASIRNRSSVDAPTRTTDPDLKIFRLKVKYNPLWETFAFKVLRKRIEVTLEREGVLTSGAYQHHTKLHVQVSKGRNRNILDFAGSNQKQVLGTHSESSLHHLFTSFVPDQDEETGFRATLTNHRTRLLLGINSIKRNRSGRQRKHRRRKRPCSSRLPLFQSLQRRLRRRLSPSNHQSRTKRRKRGQSGSGYQPTLDFYLNSTQEI